MSWSISSEFTNKNKTLRSIQMKIGYEIKQDLSEMETEFNAIFVKEHIS